MSGYLYRSGTSFTFTLLNYALLSNPIFGGSNLYFLTTGNNGWNISYTSSSFGISLNDIIMAISINSSGIVTIPAGISGYSNTSQVNTLISNNLSSYSNTTATNTLITNALTSYSTTSQTNNLISDILTNYVSNSTLSSYSTTAQTNNLISTSIVTNQNIMSINFLTFVGASDFSSNVYNYNSLFQALMVDVSAATSGLGNFIQANGSNFINGYFFIYRCVVIQLHIILISRSK